MKIKTSVLAACMLIAAGATGTPDHVPMRSTSDVAPDKGAAIAGAGSHSLEAKSYYAPAYTYVAPKVPI